MTEQEIKNKIDNKICLQCGNTITDDNILFCEDCYEKSIKYVENNNLSNEWTIYSVILFLGIFGYNGKEFSIERLKEIFCKDENNNN